MTVVCSNETLPYRGKIMAPNPVVTALSGANAAQGSADDPIARLQAIMESTLADEEKAALIEFATNRFRNRRHMAKVSFYVIVGMVGVLLLFALFDGTTAPPTILDNVLKLESLLKWILGFLTSIIAFYFGASTVRPSS